MNNRVTIRNLTDDKFKTMRISINLLVPLSEETATGFALIPSLLTRATKEYPTTRLLSQQMANLYGASLDSSVTKIGDNQLINLYISGIADEFSLDNENLSNVYSSMLCNCITNPLVDENGDFDEESFNQEKRQLLETMDADFNDKKTYARTRCREIMFDGQPAGIRRYGSRESLERFDRLKLKELLSYVKNNSKVDVLVMGNCNFDDVKSVIENTFKSDEDAYQPVLSEKTESNGLKEITENFKVAQSKLVMGFTTGVKSNESIPSRLMCTLLGSTPSSKLFLNVREKLSLCYYCSSNMDIKKSAMFIESGVETKNIEVAKSAILNEVEEIKKGNFTDEDLYFAKLYTLNSYKGVGDSLFAVETFNISQILNKKLTTPQEMSEKMNAVTREEIICAANKLTLDTVYVLKGELADE